MNFSFLKPMKIINIRYVRNHSIKVISNIENRELSEAITDHLLSLKSKKESPAPNGSRTLLGGQKIS